MGPDSVKMMCQGNIFYIYTSTSRAPVTIFYVPNTPDNLGSFYWCRVGELIRHEQCKFPLSILTDVMMGKQTPSFQRPHAAQARSEQCMSLVSSMLTLDLEAVSEQVICDWVDGLTYILSVEGSKDLVDDGPTTAQTTVVTTTTAPPPQVSQPTRTGPPPSGAGAGGNKRRFTVHGTGSEDAAAAATAAAANNSGSIPQQQQGSFDDDEDETISGHAPLSGTISEKDDPLLQKAQYQAKIKQADDGLTTLQRGGIVVHYRLNKPPQIAYVCHHTKPEQLLGSLFVVPLAPVNNFTNNPTLTYSGYDARLLSQELRPETLHLLRSIAIGDVVKTKQVAADFQNLTNGSMTILTTAAPPPLPSGAISSSLQHSASSLGSSSTSFSTIGGGPPPLPGSQANNNNQTICLDAMSDLFLGSTHQDFLSAKQCDPAAALSIITDLGSFSMECTDKYTLSLWITDLQNLLSACGTDVVAAEGDNDDEYLQHQQQLQEKAMQEQQQRDLQEAQQRSPPSTANRNRRFTVTRTDMPTSAVPAAAIAAARGNIQPVQNPNAEIDPLEIAFRSTGLEFVQFPGAIPCILTITGVTGSQQQQVILTDKFKKTLIDSAVLTELSQVTQGTAHTRILSTCGQPTLAITLAFKSSVTGGTNTWYLTASNIETYNVFACGLTQYLYHLNRSLRLSQLVPSRIFNAQAGLHPYQQTFKANNTSSIMMAMYAGSDAADEFQADLPSLISMLTQGRIFTGFAERENDIVMNKLTLFFMSPQELLSISTMDPKKAQDPTRAAKLKTNVGPIDPNTKGRLCWCTAGRRVPMKDSYLDIDEITDIFVGKQTKVLDDHAGMFPKERCFTIMAANDQLDLVTENGLQLLSWMRALHSLCGMTTTSVSQSSTTEGLKEVEIDQTDQRLASGARGKRFSVSGGQGGAGAQPPGMGQNVSADKKKRLSLLVTGSTPPPKPMGKDIAADVKDPRLTLGRGARFLRAFTSHGQIKTQQIWVYHTSSSDSSDPSKRAGSLRWVPLGVLAETLGMAANDPNPLPSGTGPTPWLSQIDRFMASIPINQLEETIKIVNNRDRDTLHGAWGVIRLAHITDVYVGRTTASLKNLVPPERHLECFSIVSRDSNKQQSVLSLRADEEGVITHWLDCIQNLILTGGKKLTTDDKANAATAGPNTTPAPAPTFTGAAPSPTIEPPKSGRRFTVTSGDPAEAAAAAAVAANLDYTQDDEQSSPPQGQTPNRQRRLTVKSNQAPPVAPTILLNEAQEKPKTQGRRFTVTKAQADEAAAAAAAASLSPSPIESTHEIPTTRSGPPPMPGTKSNEPEVVKVATPVPEPIKSPMPQVAPEVWAKLIKNEGVQSLLNGVEVTIYTAPKDEEYCAFTSVLQGNHTQKDIGLETSQGRIHAKRAMLYYSQFGGKAGSVFIHTLNPDPSIAADIYQQTISVYEFNKFTSELNIECMPVHTLTDITVGKNDPMWKLVTAADSKPLDTENSTNQISSSCCLSLTSKFKPSSLVPGSTSSPEAIVNAQQNGGKVKKQLHLTTKTKQVVQGIVQVLQYVIAQSGKKVLSDQQPKEAPSQPPTPTATSIPTPIQPPPTPIQPPPTPAAAIPPPTPVVVVPAPTPTQPQYHDIADLTNGYQFIQYVRAGVGIKQFNVTISLHKSTQVMFTPYSSNQDPSKSNLGRTHELAPTVRSFDLHSSTSVAERGQPAMPNVAPVTAQDITWRGLVESSGLGFFCVKDTLKDSKVWLPLGALTDVYLGQSANVPSNARTPQSMYTLTFSLTGGSAYHLVLSAQNEEAGKNWLLQQINGGDAEEEPQPTVDQQAEATGPVPSTGDPQMDEVIAYMSKRHLMFAYSNVSGRLCRLRAQVWYDPALHAIVWCTTDTNARAPMYSCPIQDHFDTPTTSPLAPPRPAGSQTRCTAACKRPLCNVLHLNAVNEVFVGRSESLLKESTTDPALSQLKIDEDSCATVTADKLDINGQPLPTTNDWDGYNGRVELNLEASSANYLEEWLNGLQHLLQLRGANLIYSS